MATAIRAVYAEGQVPAIIDIVSRDPGIVLTDREKFNDFYARMKEETDKLQADTSTAKGRDDIRRMATRVRDTKAAIDKKRLELTKEKRDWIDNVNAAGKEIKDSLQALEDEVRKPLTDWEEAEKARVDECEAVIQRIRDAATVTIEDTFASVQLRGSSVHQTEIDLDRFGTLAEAALLAKKATIDHLMDAMKRLKKEEADRAELERLRAEQAEREAREVAEREAREKAEREAEQARQAQERAEREAAEAKEREERIAREAEERARQQAEQQARAEQERIQREHEAALQAERDRAAEAERQAQAERNRIAAQEQAARQQAEREAEEKRRVEANKELQRALKTEAKLAIMSCGISEDAAQKLVLAVRAGEIPHITWAAKLPQQEA